MESFRRRSKFSDGFIVILFITSSIKSNISISQFLYTYCASDINLSKICESFGTFDNNQGKNFKNTVSIFFLCVLDNIYEETSDVWFVVVNGTVVYDMFN